MRSASFYLQKRASEPWIIGEGCDRFAEYAQQALSEIVPLTEVNLFPKILIAEADPIKFLAKFLAAVATESPVFLANSQWQKNEWKQAISIVKPNLVWGVSSPTQPVHKDNHKWRNSIMIPTGGSSGNIRFAIHNWETLTASVTGFSQYFQTDVINSFCLLPPYHVSGLMQFMRSLITGGNLIICPSQKVNFQEFTSLNLADFLISLVPTQLQQLLPSQNQYLSQFKTILLGGAPPWKDLLEAARNARLPLALTYGMTETASQIIALKPSDFLKGNSSNGRVLPHAQVFIAERAIAIKSKSLYRGYYPNLVERHDEYWPTDDLGYFDERGYLHILGRNSDKIITGGENVFPYEVESAIRATNLVNDVRVIGLADTYWGQIVTAIYVPTHNLVTTERIVSAISQQIAKFKQPKYWVSVESIPLNLQGKVNRQQLLNIATDWLKQHRSNQS